MLRILKLPTRASVSQLIEGFDPQTATWVVSDLRSKFEVQQHLLDKQGGYLDSDVLRASDLWKILLKRVRPEIRLVSRDFARSVVRSFLRANREALQLDVVSEKSVLSAMDRFAGVVFHPDGAGTVRQWFEEHPESAARWGKSYFLSRASLGHLHAQNMLTAKWVAAVLQGEPDFALHWDKPLIVDLGAELSGAEAQLFRDLSRHVDVTLLEPAPDWVKETEPLLRPYKDVSGFAEEVTTLAVDPVEEKPRRVLRFSGQLAEVKEAVARTRRWIEDGVPMDRIAILAADIEEYWPVLRAYLDEEGIPSDKSVTVKLNSFPSVNRWLSRLRPRRGEVTAADLELGFYGSEKSAHLRSEEFQALFAQLYGEEDVRRHPLVEKFFRDGPVFKDIMTRDEFLLTAVAFWDNRDDFSPGECIGREVLANAAPSTEMPVTEWIQYLESVAASREMTLEAARGDGVLVTNFLSARSTGVTHRIFLGLTEESLKKAERNPLPIRDIIELSQLGFHIDHPDHSLLEFELKWLSVGSPTEDVYTVGNSGFDGSVRAPSSVWLQMRKDHPEEGESEKLTVPEPTRWDSLQTAAPEVWGEARQWDEGRKNALVRRLRTDLGEEAPIPVMVPAPKSVSPSFVTKYLDCPFIVAGSTLFRLKDLAEIDLDVARSDWGTLTHAVFQKLTDEGWLERENVSEPELVDLIEGLRAEKRFTLGEEKLWGPFLRRQVKVALEFLRVERAWKKRFPAMKLLPSESVWSLWFDPNAGSFHREDGEGRIRFTGRLDRLETDGEGRYVVVDYKAGAANLSDQHAWMSENELQLLFYMWALERGALPVQEGRAIGAFYYVYRDFSRNRGLQIESEAEKLFPAAGKRKNLGVDEARKIELFEQLEGRIREVMKNVAEGRWQPEPSSTDTCRRCAWNALCRARHLN